MPDLFGNHIVGFPTRWLKYLGVGHEYERDVRDLPYYIEVGIVCSYLSVECVFNSVNIPFKIISAHMRQDNQ